MKTIINILNFEILIIGLVTPIPYVHISLRNSSVKSWQLMPAGLNYIIIPITNHQKVVRKQIIFHLLTVENYSEITRKKLTNRCLFFLFFLKKCLGKFLPPFLSGTFALIT